MDESHRIRKKPVYWHGSSACEWIVIFIACSKIGYDEGYKKHAPIDFPIKATLIIKLFDLVWMRNVV